MRFDQVVDEKSDDNGGVCNTVVSRKCRGSGFGWVEYISMGETDELAGNGVRDVIPPDHASDCVERRRNHASRKPEKSKTRVSGRSTLIGS